MSHGIPLLRITNLRDWQLRETGTYFYTQLTFVLLLSYHEYGVKINKCSVLTSTFCQVFQEQQNQAGSEITEAEEFNTIDDIFVADTL